MLALIAEANAAYARFDPATSTAAEKGAEVARHFAVVEQITDVFSERLQEAWSGDERVLFASHPTSLARTGRREAFGRDLALITLELDREAVESYATVEARTVSGFGTRTPRSLLDAAAKEFLGEGADALARGLAGGSKTPTELLRRAGGALIGAAVTSVGPLNPGRTPWRTLADSAIADISAWRYEGAEGSGRILICSQDDPRLRPDFRFAHPTSLWEARAARKLLEMTRGGGALLCDGSVMYGVAQAPGEPEGVFSIEVKGRHEWELASGSKRLMRVVAGEPRLPARIFEKDVFRSALTRTFLDVDDHLLADLAAAAAATAHVALLVVSTEAAEEARRLANQSTPIDPPTPVRQEDIASLAAIDGAVLVDPSGVCYAAGVILDGLATEAGTSARGARFNSSLRYVLTRRRLPHAPRCLAVVVSEDGTVDVVPPIRRPATQYRIREALREFHAACSDTPPIDPWRVSHAYAELDEIRPDLTAEQCTQANVSLALALADDVTRDPYGEIGEFRNFRPVPDDE